MINLYKILIISMLCYIVYGCKSTSNVDKRDNIENIGSTQDLRDEQIQDYDQEMQQQNEENNN